MTASTLARSGGFLPARSSSSEAASSNRPSSISADAASNLTSSASAPPGYRSRYSFAAFLTPWKSPSSSSARMEVSSCSRVSIGVSCGISGGGDVEQAVRSRIRKIGIVARIIRFPAGSNPRVPGRTGQACDTPRLWSLSCRRLLRQAPS